MNLRRATAADIPFLIEADARVDSEQGESYRETISAAELDAIRARFVAMVEVGQAFIASHDDGRDVGMIAFRVQHRDALQFPHALLTHGAEHIPTDGRFGEVYQLWVEPGVRRQGLGLALKRRFEAEMRAAGVGLLYTHTREENAGVLAMNLALGYRELYRGALWDDAVRICLVKAVPD